VKATELPRTLAAGARHRVLPALRPRQAWQQAKARRWRRRLAGPKLIEAFAEVNARPFFIEIGSNDGQQHDHLRGLIHARGWSGIMVEPVPYVFERLRANYGGADGVALENAAIADRNGTLPFYHLAEATGEERDRLPTWYDAIGSFSREVVLGHAAHIPDIEDRIVRTEVPCLTFEALCDKHRAANVDLLLIDTEGYDHEIIKRIDLGTHRPRLLIYEHYHLPPAERAECRSRVEGFGYETLEEGFDTFCLLTEPDDELSNTWRRVEPGIPGLFASDEDRP